MELLELFNYEFMRRAFIVGTLLAIILPCIGLSVVLKRVSMIGDTLSHASLAGVTVGLFIGYNPLIGSVIACIIAGLSIEFIRNRLNAYQEISTVIMLAASIGVAGVFTSFLNNTNSISAYLFGSIVTISDQELYFVIAIAVSVLIIYKLMYNELYLTVFDQRSATLLGINTKRVNFIFTFLCAISVSIAAKTIGSLIVSSLLVIPVVSAMQFVKSYKHTLILSIVFSIIYVNFGLLVSYFYNLKPGSVIVLTAVISLLFIMIIKPKSIKLAK